MFICQTKMIFLLIFSSKFAIMWPYINEFEIMTKSLSDISFDIVNVAEKAAIACYDWIGKGDNKAADAAAVKSMRETLNEIDIDGTVVIGEGERDEAPMLFIGEEVGLKKNGPKVDIALDPLEGTTICADGTRGSLAVIALAESGNFLHAPDVYMQKIAVGPGLPSGVVDLDNSAEENLKSLAKAKGCEVSDLRVLILDRDRHKDLIADHRKAGAKVSLITDGDVAGVVSCVDGTSGIDMYVGTGGAPEGVLAAAALKTIGGQMQGRLIFNDNQKQIDRAKKMGITDLDKKYSAEEMAKGDVIFVCSGVTDGDMLNGIKKNNGKVRVNTLVMDSKSGTVTKVDREYY